MKKGIITGVALVAVLATLTGCGKSEKKLTCTNTTSNDSGFSTSEELVYKFKDNRVTTAKITQTIVAEDDYAKYIDDYKQSAETAVENYNKTKGISAKVDTGSNKVSVTIDLKASEMDDNEKTSYELDESYESMKDRKTEQGYTCK